MLLTLPLVAQMVAMMLGGLGGSMDQPDRPGMEVLLATPVQFVIGARFYRGCLERAAPARATWTCSWSWAPRRPTWLQLLPARDAWAAAARASLYFEASAVIITLVLLGKFMEAAGQTGHHRRYPRS